MTDSLRLRTKERYHAVASVNQHSPAIAHLT